MTYPKHCAKCAKPLAQRTGRPTRWCSSGCRLAGEAEMRRIHSVLGKLELGRAIDLLNNWDTTQRDETMANLSARYDTLCGVESAESGSANA